MRAVLEKAVRNDFLRVPLCCWWLQIIRIGCEWWDQALVFRHLGRPRRTRSFGSLRCFRRTRLRFLR
jgi:hypothetical protein